MVQLGTRERASRGFEDTSRIACNSCAFKISQCSRDLGVFLSDSSFNSRKDLFLLLHSLERRVLYRFRGSVETNVGDVVGVFLFTRSTTPSRSARSLCLPQLLARLHSVGLAPSKDAHDHRALPCPARAARARGASPAHPRHTIALGTPTPSKFTGRARARGEPTQWPHADD
jgi:hypothetical protein